MSFVPQRPVLLHIHVTFSQNDHASYLESESFLFLPASHPPTAHLTASAEHKTLITSCLLHFDHKPEASFVCCSDPLDVTGNWRGSESVCVELCSSLSGPCKDLDLNNRCCCVHCGGGFFCGRILTMNESSAWAGWKRPQPTRGAGRSRHRQPSARPWTRSIWQHYILHYSSLGTESCQNSRAMKGNQLELFQMNPQGILFRPVWPPDCL